MKLKEPSNIMYLDGHIGRHTNAYHLSVYKNLSSAIEGLSSQQEIGQALRSELNSIKEELIKNPNLIRAGK